MSKKVFCFQRTGYDDIDYYEGDSLVQKGMRDFQVARNGHIIAEVSDVDAYWTEVRLTYDEIWDAIDRESREHLDIDGHEFMRRYFDDQMKYYYLPVFRSLCHMADLIKDEYKESQLGPVEPQGSQARL